MIRQASKHSVFDPGLLVLALLAFAGIFVVFQVGETQEQTEVDARKLGFVNIMYVFNNYDATEDFENKFSQRQEEIQNEIRALEEDISQTEQEIQDLDRTENSNLWQEKVRELVQMRSERDFLQEMGMSELQQDLRENTAETYNTIRDQIQEYASNNNLDIVLAKTPRTLNPDQVNNVEREIRLRTVLYNRSDDEISEDILQQLNEEYNSE